MEYNTPYWLDRPPNTSKLAAWRSKMSRYIKQKRYARRRRKYFKSLVMEPPTKEQVRQIMMQN